MSTTPTDPGDSNAAPSAEPTERPRETKRMMLIDRFLPTFDVSKSRHRIVNAPAERVWAALRALDFAAIPSPLLRLGIALQRQVRKRSLQRGGDGRAPLPRKLTFDNPEEYSRIKLGEEPGLEILIGAVVKLERPRETEKVSPTEFVSFDRPGYVKGVASFSVHPYGGARSLLVYETRAQATDPVTRRRLFRMWRLLEPLTLLMMDRVLAHVAHQAERIEHAEAA